MEGFYGLGVFTVVMLSLLIVLAVIHIQSKRCSEQHTLFSMIVHYAILNMFMVVSWMMKWQFEKETKNCTQVQEKTLMKILRENADTVYGQEYKLGELSNKQEFVANHPLTLYEHYKPYIDRVANGETKILTSQTPRELASTSGTTGNSKLLIIEKSRSFTTTRAVLPAVYQVKAVYPQTKSLQKAAMFLQPYVPKFRKSKGGLAITNGMPDISKSRFLTIMYTSPPAAFEIPTEPESLYVHLLFALKDRELGAIETVFAMHLYHSLVALETNWENLVLDIGRGRVKEDLAISEVVKSDLNKLLRPDPQRADELKVEFLKGIDNTIVRRIWPHINYVVAVTSGSSAFYAEKVSEKYLDIPIISYFYGSTEGYVGTNIWPEKQNPEYVMIPSAQFFEFIPIENMEEDQPKTLFAEDVEVGSVYELVVTNCNGLYRFRMGDVVKVVRFYNKAPVLQYQYRSGQLLNVHAEKTSEKMIYEALQATLKDSYTSAELVDYTCTESVMLGSQDVEKDVKGGGETALQKFAPHYIMFLEFAEGQDIIKTDLKTFAKQLDQNICDRNPMYESFRCRDGISVIQVYMLKSGTFDKLIQFYHNRNPLVSCRFKLPRLTKVKEGLELLLSNVI